VECTACGSGPHAAQKIAKSGLLTGRNVTVKVLSLLLRVELSGFRVAERYKHFGVGLLQNQSLQNGMVRVRVSQCVNGGGLMINSLE
jgi:hypothetical protein